MNKHIEDLAQCLEKAKFLLASAENSEWETVEAQINDYQQAIASLADVNFSEEDAPRARQLLNEIKPLDNRIRALAEQYREEIFQGLKTRNKGKKMKQAYGQASRSGRS